MDARWVLERAAFIAGRYDRNAQEEVLLNRSARFHLCGLIERAASVPRSGATHRRSIDNSVIVEAKAKFCLAHKVVHPAAWEFQCRRSSEDVAAALKAAAGG